MGQERTTAALGRIERALARIEALATAAPPPAARGEAFDKLKRSHLMLRDRVEGAIGQIDQLLDHGERR